MMTKLVSCCGADWFYWLKHYDNEHPDPHEFYMVRYCPKCNRPSMPAEEKSQVDKEDLGE